MGKMRYREDSGYTSLSSTDALSHFSPKNGSQDYNLDQPRLPTSPSRLSGEYSHSNSGEPAYFTRDGRQRIPLSAVGLIAQKLRDQATTSYLDLHQFGIESNISFQSLEQLIHARAKGDFPRVIIDVDDSSYLCSDAFVNNIETTIRNAATETSSGVVDLTAAFAHQIPSQIILALATEATGDLNGEVHLTGDHVMWSRSCSSCSSKRQADPTRDKKISEIVESLTNDGYSVLPEPRGEVNVPDEDDDLEQSAISAFMKANPHDAKPQVIYTRTYHAIADLPSSIPRVLVRPRILYEELEITKLAAVHRAELLWRDDCNSDAPHEILRQLEPSDFHTPHNVELSQILIRSDFAEDIEQAIQARTAQLERHRYDEFTSLIETRLWCPLHLYAAGVLEIDDQILKNDLEDYALRQFCRENIPETVTTIHKRKVVHDRQRRSAIARLESASQNVRSFTELQAAVAQVGKYLNIDSPCEELVLQVKHRSLETTVDEMIEMERGLDVLQNLIWVLLATSGPGLFVSSVKYTSKMIRHYDLVGGDAEISGLLSLWWEKVRAGTLNPEDLRQMKQLAREAVVYWREEK